MCLTRINGKTVISLGPLWALAAVYLIEERDLIKLMSKISYRVFTKRDAIEWQKANPPSDKLSDLLLGRELLKGLPDSAWVAVVAIDKGKIVGRNFVFPATIFINGERIDCRCSGDLYVKPEYRTKGVGLYIKMHMLNMGLPQIVGGTSGPMQKIYTAWGKYQLIDDSPVFALPLSISALLFYGRLSYYRQTNASGPTGWPVLAKILLELHLSARRFTKLRSINCTVLPPNLAVNLVDSILVDDLYPCQIPWDREKVAEALHLQKDDNYSWVFEIRQGTDTNRYFANVYVKRREVRLVSSKKAVIKEAQLSEIFPPVQDRTVFQEIISSLRNELLKLRFDSILIYALNETMADPCTEIGLPTFFNKTVSIAANDLEEPMASDVSTPENWWCRAYNEEQFKETSTQY